MQALLKAKPARFNMGSSGNGTVIHLAGEMFVDAIGVQVQHIPYQGTGPTKTCLSLVFARMQAVQALCDGTAACRW